MAGSNSNNVVLFPLMGKGHMIPIINLARILLSRYTHISITIFTTKANCRFISEFLSGTSVSIIGFSFPKNVSNGNLAGVENTENLPSPSLLPDFFMSTKLLKQEFEEQLQILDPRTVRFLVSDAFLWWTVESASKFGIPRILFNGMSNYLDAITSAFMKDHRFQTFDFESRPDDELITVPDLLPFVKITRTDYEPVFYQTDHRASLHFEFLMAVSVSINQSYGVIVNSFYELEPVFYDHCKTQGQGQLERWCVGPLCLVEPETHARTGGPVSDRERFAPEKKIDRPTWLKWLDEKLDQGKPVLYVAFGSQANNISSQQMQEIAIGLEESKLNFLWAKKERETNLENGFEFEFEKRVKERGIVVREWVNQWEILNHESVKGFLSHCGWNSVLESICCGVPILAWPLMADQALNARMVVEEMKIGVRVKEKSCGGFVKDLIKREQLERKVRELVNGEKGKLLEKKAIEFSNLAKKAMGKNGSSWNALEQLVKNLCT